MRNFLLILLFIHSTSIFARDARYRIEPFLCGSANFLAGSSADRWEPSVTVGAGVRFPVVALPLNFSISIETGEMSDVDSLSEYGMFLTSLLVEYEVKLHDRFRLITGGGVGNMLITAREGMDITKPFAGESENEFGFAIVVEPIFLIHHFFLSLRLQDRYILSYPEQVNTLSVSIVGGWRF